MTIGSATSGHSFDGLERRFEFDHGLPAGTHDGNITDVSLLNPSDNAPIRVSTFPHRWGIPNQDRC